jgi:hypothetical protein
MSVSQKSENQGTPGTLPAEWQVIRRPVFELPEKAAIILEPGVSRHPQSAATGQQSNFLSDNHLYFRQYKARHYVNRSIHFAQLSDKHLSIQAVTRA